MNLREKIASLPRYEPDHCDRMGNRSDMMEDPEGDWIKRDDALAALDAHTAAQPAPDAGAEADPVGWRVRERPGFAWHFVDGDPDRDPTLRNHEKQPLYAAKGSRP